MAIYPNDFRTDSGPPGWGLEQHISRKESLRWEAWFRSPLLLWEEIVAKEKKVAQSQWREKKDCILPLILFTQSHSFSYNEATLFLPQLIFCTSLKVCSWFHHHHLRSCKFLGFETLARHRKINSWSVASTMWYIILKVLIRTRAGHMEVLLQGAAKFSPLDLGKGYNGVGLIISHYCIFVFVYFASQICR